MKPLNFNSVQSYYKFTLQNVQYLQQYQITLSLDSSNDTSVNKFLWYHKSLSWLCFGNRAQLFKEYQVSEHVLDDTWNNPSNV